MSRFVDPEDAFKSPRILALAAELRSAWSAIPPHQSSSPTCVCGRPHRNLYPSAPRSAHGRGHSALVHFCSEECRRRGASR